MAPKRAAADPMNLRVKEVFKRFDKDGGGSLGLNEVEVLLKSLGDFTSEQLMFCCAELDKSGDGDVSLVEFQNWIKQKSSAAKQVAKAIIRDTDQSARIREFFLRFDKNGNNVLDIAELRKAFKSLSASGNFDEQAISGFIKSIDKSGDGQISFKEMSQWIRRGADGAKDVAKSIEVELGEKRTKKIREAFNRYDADGGGSLDIAELKDALKTMGAFTSNEVRNICSDLDSSGDGEVDFKEFEAWIRDGTGAKEICKAKAILAPGDDDGLEAVFYNFCGPGQAEIDGKGLVKMCKDSGLLDFSMLTETVIDLIFNSLKAKGERRLDFSQFEVALKHLAEKKGVAREVVAKAVLEATRPILNGTKGETVTFESDRLAAARARGSISVQQELKKKKKKIKQPQCALQKTELVPVDQFHVDNTNTWKAFGITTPSGLSLKRLYGARVALPMTGKGQAQRRCTDFYEAVNSMNSASDGLRFYRSRTLHDPCPGSERVPWGSCIQGERLDACWLKVGDRYLPAHVAGFHVLQMCDAPPSPASLRRAESLPTLQATKPLYEPPIVPQDFYKAVVQSRSATDMSTSLLKGLSLHRKPDEERVGTKGSLS